MVSFFPAGVNSQTITQIVSSELSGFVSLFFSYLAPCTRLCWPPVSFRAHVNIPSHIVSYHMDSVFSVLSQEIGWEERLRNDLFCVRWDVKP